ncbi:hypothetical protein MTO96_047228 [Rhipicephalus appendiculatus]
MAHAFTLQVSGTEEMRLHRFATAFAEAGTSIPTAAAAAVLVERDGLRADLHDRSGVVGRVTSTAGRPMSPGMPERAISRPAGRAPRWVEYERASFIAVYTDARCVCTERRVLLLRSPSTCCYFRIERRTSTSTCCITAAPKADCPQRT